MVREMAGFRPDGGSIMIGGKNKITTATKRRLPRQKTHPHARDVTDH